MGIELTKFEISFNLSKKTVYKNFHENFRSPRKTRCYRQIPRKFLVNPSKKNEAYRGKSHARPQER